MAGVPAGAVLIVPVPETTLNVRVYDSANVAVTVRFAVIVGLQAPVPEQALPQLVNALPPPALCVTVTCVPVS